jgi:peptide-methionine (S)-S-oxide reductase
MNQRETITLGGGCFWCTEAVFVRVKGVLDVESGYCNGELIEPSYEQVCTGLTGHCEVVRLVFDRQQISLREILNIFFAIHDPTTLNAQGHDHGTQYRSGVYWEAPEQGALAQAMIDELEARAVFPRPIVTEVLACSNYWPAEDYHQDFFERNPSQGYCLAVAAPKVAKLRRSFTHLLRD